jgi:hypothetical protein
MALFEQGRGFEASGFTLGPQPDGETSRENPS